MVPVYDRLNPKRLLGHLHQYPDLTPNHRMISVAVMPYPMLFPSPAQEIAQKVSYNVLQFHVSWVFRERGWAQAAILLTDATLDLLMECREFTLPGEDERSADDRRYTAAIYRDPRRR